LSLMWVGLHVLIRLPGVITSVSSVELGPRLKVFWKRSGVYNRYMLLLRY